MNEVIWISLWIALIWASAGAFSIITAYILISFLRRMLGSCYASRNDKGR